MSDVPTVVIDASAVVEVVRAAPATDSIREHVLGADLVAPAILDLEVLSALRRLERAGEIRAERAAEAVADLASFAARRIPTTVLAEAAWAMRHSLRIADAFYVALARTLGADLVTLDARLAGAPGLGITVVVPAA